MLAFQIQLIVLKIKGGANGLIVNLDKQFTDLRGNPIGEKLSDVLADILATSTQGKPAKMIAWAVDLVNKGQFSTGEPDLNFIAGLVEGSPSLTNLAKVQLLEELDIAKIKENQEA